MSLTYSDRVEFRRLRLALYAVLVFVLILEPITLGRFQVPPERAIMLLLFVVALANSERKARVRRSGALLCAIGGLILVLLTSTVTYFATGVGVRQTVTAALVPIALFTMGVWLTGNTRHLQNAIWVAVIGLVVSTVTVWVWQRLGMAYPLYHESKGFLAYIINVGSSEISIWANWTAAFGVLLSVLSLFVTILDASLVRRLVAAGTFLLGTYIAFQSGAKAGPVGIVLFSIVCIAAFAKEVFTRHSGTLFFCVVALISFGLYRGIQTNAVSELLNIETHIHRFSDFGQNYGSVQYRLDALSYSWEQGRMGLIGIGFGRAWTLDSIDESMYLLWLGNGAGFMAILGHLIFFITLIWTFGRSATSSDRRKAVAARCGVILLLVAQLMSFSSDQFLGEAITGHWLFFLLGAIAGVTLVGVSSPKPPQSSTGGEESRITG